MRSTQNIWFFFRSNPNPQLLSFQNIPHISNITFVLELPDATSHDKTKQRKMILPIVNREYILHSSNSSLIYHHPIITSRNHPEHQTKFPSFILRLTSFQKLSYFKFHSSNKTSQLKKLYALSKTKWEGKSWQIYRVSPIR